MNNKYLSYSDCRCVCSTQEFCSRTETVFCGNFCPDQILVRTPAAEMEKFCTNPEQFDEAEFSPKVKEMASNTMHQLIQVFYK